MHENEALVQRAVLIAADTGEYDVSLSLDELEELAHTAGAEVLARATQKRSDLDPGTVLGKGRLEEIAAYCRENDINTAIFDHELTASQIRNVEGLLDLVIIDRTTLILDIFAQRAHTSEGRLQVELAQQRYLLPRLMGLGTALSRLGGGIGTRGPGETKLESDRRHIRRRVSALEEELEQLSRRRQLMRSRRKKDGVTTVAIVGYTNAGKSTLLNALTGAGVLAEDKLFATLDPTSRALLLPDGRSVMLIDTVGLIRRLPHHLVEAFRSTLEEAAEADLLLNVCDASDPEMEEHLAVTRQLFADLGVGDTPVLTLLNKCDRLPVMPTPTEETLIPLSAKEGIGFDRLLQAIAKALPPTQRRLLLLLPYNQGGLLDEIRREGKVFSEEYVADGTLVDALVDNKILHKVEGIIQKR